MQEMKTKITKWGNSLGVRIPKILVEELGVSSETQMEIFIKGDSIVLMKPKYDLDTMLNQVSPENIHIESQTGKVIGKETW